MRSLRYGELGLTAPERWVDVSVVTLVAPDAGGYAPNVVLTRESAPKKQAIDACARAHLVHLKRAMNQHELVAEDEVEIDGAPAHRFEHRFVSDEKVEVHQLQYFFFTGGDVAVLSLTCAAGTLARHRPLFESIAASVRREPTDV